MFFQRTLCAITVSGVALTGVYFGFRYWRALQVYPPIVKKELREALRSAHNGRSGDAERHYHEALRHCINEYGGSSEATQSILLKMAEFYYERGRSDRAANIYESLLTKTIKLARGNWNAEIRKSLADIYTELDRLEDANRLYQEALQIVVSDNEPSVIGPIYEGLGDVKFKETKYTEAIEFYTKAADYCERDQGRKSVEYVTLMNNIASVNFAIHTPECIDSAKLIASKALSLAHNSKDDDKRMSPLIENLKTILSQGES